MWIVSLLHTRRTPVFSRRCLPILTALTLGTALIGCEPDKGQMLQNSSSDSSQVLDKIPASNTPDPTQPRAEKDKSLLPTEKELGLPYYPKAHAYVGPGGTITASASVDSLTMVVLETTDPIEKVATYYQEQLKDAHRSEEKDKDTLKSVRFSVAQKEAGNSLRSVEIVQQDKSVHIKLINLPASQSADTISKSAEAFKSSAGAAVPPPSSGSGGN